MSWAWMLSITVVAGAGVVLGVPSTGRRRMLGQLVNALPGVPPVASPPATAAELGGRQAWRTHLVVAGVTAAAGWAVAGRVGAGVAAVYGTLVARALLRKARQRAAREARRKALDDLVTLAAELRAGLPPAGVLQRPAAHAGDQPLLGEARLDGLARAVWRLGERTGAPAADLVDRIEADARAADRAQAMATAEVAGARVTALLLVLLPVGGILLGYGVGVDPVEVLFHSRIGAVCAFGAAGLQFVGLVWVDRITTEAATP